MPSKTSPRHRNSSSLWKAEPACSEKRVLEIASELAGELQKADRVLLEGPLGAGKSTFARQLLQALKVQQPSEGSPTFAIAHEYRSSKFAVIHVDFYRIKSEDEIEDAGIPEYFWNKDGIVLSEWTSLFPEFEKSVVESAASGSRVWRVELKIISESERDLEIKLHC